jgi:hypothetical protein
VQAATAAKEITAWERTVLLRGWFVAKGLLARACGDAEDAVQLREQRRRVSAGSGSASPPAIRH